MDPIGKHLKAPEIKQKGRQTERGEALLYISRKTGMTIPRVAFHVSHLKEMKDLYFLISDCDKAEKRGVPWGAAFWTALKPHEK